jgi:dipeptidase E
MSSTFKNDKLKDTFLQMLTKPIKENKVLIIHQKRYVKKTYPEYSELADTMLPLDIKIFTELGILPENISLYDVDSNEKLDLSEIDVLLVEGGNTFYYLHKIRKKGYRDDIRGFIERDGVYLGTSAGSMMMGPYIDENLTIDVNFNEWGLENTTGFGYFDFHLLVHWDSVFDDLHTDAIKYCWDTGKRVIPLTDQQAVLVMDNDFKIISP